MKKKSLKKTVAKKIGTPISPSKEFGRHQGLYQNQMFKTQSFEFSKLTVEEANKTLHNKYCQTLSDFKTKSAIKKKQLSAGDQLHYLNKQVRKYRDAIEILKEYPITNDYKKIIKFIDAEIINGLSEKKIELESGLEIDLSKTKAIEKIIFLSELGVLEFLRDKSPFNTTINSLATILSAITGENNTTLQPSLNAMFSNAVDKSKDPYKTKNTVEKVRNQLINIGFKLK
jgi:hypothetical protein